MTETAAATVEITAQRFDRHAFAAIDVTVAPGATLVIMQTERLILTSRVMTFRVRVVTTTPRRRRILGTGSRGSDNEQAGGNHE